MTVLVREFHARFDLPAPSEPPLVPSDAEVRLRARLVREEYEEVMAEFSRLTHAKTPQDALDVYRALLKELCDLKYVVEGAAVTFGLPMDDAYAEVHRSNMSKEGRRADGKILKGPSYRDASMLGLLPDFIEQEDA